MSLNAFKKITVIGNLAGGKTNLSLKLSQLYQLPLIHVDSIQFNQDLSIRNLNETKNFLNDIMQKDSWLIDGYGPLDILNERFAKADRIILIDLPIWRHYFWLLKRQLKNMWSKRQELPKGSNELTWKHSKKLWKTIGRIHHIMRPEILKILERVDLKDKVIYIHNLKQLNQIGKSGL